MKILASLTPQQWDVLIKTWLTIGTDLIVPLTSFIGGVLGFLAFLKARVNEARLDRHGATLNTIQRELPPTPKP